MGEVPGEGETGGARACRRCCGMAEERRWVQRTRSRCAGESHCGRCCLLEMVGVQAHVACVAAVAEDVRGSGRGRVEGSSRLECWWRRGRDERWMECKQAVAFPTPSLQQIPLGVVVVWRAENLLGCLDMLSPLRYVLLSNVRRLVPVCVERGKREGRGEGRAAGVCDGRAGLRV